MHFVEATTLAIALLTLPAVTGKAVHQQRYSMGTMFDIVAYHAPRSEAERAVTEALEEVARLDAVLSHFKYESDVSKLNREARHGFVAVDPALYDVLQESIKVSRASGGKFDVTVAPLVRLWKRAYEDGRELSAAELASARRCVGYEAIALDPPNRVRYRSACLEIELGGIGKGYAVDRALAVLRSAGIRSAVVNAGTSSMTAIGAPPGKGGWSVLLGAHGEGREIVLSDRSLSTSQQDGTIIDPESGAPVRETSMVTVSAPSATLADALSTALLIMKRADGARMIERFPGISVIYSPH